MLPVLYSFRRCPYAMRARMAMLVSATTCELREVALKNKPPEMIAISPKATVPVLQLPDGQVIDESFDIMRWALGHHDPEHWLDADDNGWVKLFDGTFKHHLDRYKYPNRYGSDALAERAAGCEILQKLENSLQENRFLCGPERKLADIAIMPFVRQYAQADRTWFDAQELPAVQHWLKALVDCHLFAQAMTVFVPWKAGDAPTLLGDAG